MSNMFSPQHSGALPFYQTPSLHPEDRTITFEQPSSPSRPWLPPPRVYNSETKKQADISEDISALLKYARERKAKERKDSQLSLLFRTEEREDKPSCLFSTTLNPDPIRTKSSKEILEDALNVFDVSDAFKSLKSPYDLQNSSKPTKREIQ